MKHTDIMEQLEIWAPAHLAYEWDPVGLQVGTRTDMTKKVLVTLDVTNAVITEAIQNNVNLIIAHHPLLFRPLNRIDIQSFRGKMIAKLIKNDITVYAAHTNLDIANGGVNDILFNCLGLHNKQNLIKTGTEKLYKLIVFVPDDYTGKLKTALGDAGAGHIGAYSHCTFQSSGKGSFKPLAGTTPFIGTENRLTTVAEQKVETIVNEKNLHKVLHAMVESHPYEEVAYDLYELKQSGEEYGLGRIGELSEPTTLKRFCQFVKSALQVKHLRFTGHQDRTIKKVAIVGGSGEKYIDAAQSAGADVLITGDLGFHKSQDALEQGFALIDPGHYVEQLAKESIARYLRGHFPNMDIFVSKVNTDPFQFL